MKCSVLFDYQRYCISNASPGSNIRQQTQGCKTLRDGPPKECNFPDIWFPQLIRQVVKDEGRDSKSTSHGVSRCALSNNGTFIRAQYGHKDGVYKFMDVFADIKQGHIPAAGREEITTGRVYHATQREFVHSILAQGLIPRTRAYVHAFNEFGLKNIAKHKRTAVLIYDVNKLKSKGHIIRKMGNKVLAISNQINGGPIREDCLEEIADFDEQANKGQTRWKNGKWITASDEEYYMLISGWGLGPPPAQQKGSSTGSNLPAKASPVD